MSRLAVIGRTLFALALVGLGTTHFRFLEFTTGRAPAWPDVLPGGAAWAVATGVTLIAAGLAILAGRRARQAALVAAALVFTWALLRHLPVVAASAFPSGEWTDGAKALRFVGGALAVAATLPGIGGGGTAARLQLLPWNRQLIVVARTALGLTLILNGLQHFVFKEFVASLIPAWFPGSAVFWTEFGGVTLILGGVGLLIPRVAQWAGLMSGIMIMCWFFIIHLTRELAGVADGVAVFEALSTAGTAFVIAGFLAAERAQRPVEMVSETRRRTGVPAGE